MKKKTRTILKRGIAFVLAMALLWTDASMSTLAANVMPEISATEDLMSATDMTETEQKSICDWMPENEFLELKKWIFQND